jgi:hypothetical protein
MMDNVTREVQKRYSTTRTGQFLSPPDVVERWNGAVTTGTLANWRAQGRGPSYQKFGTKVR